MEEFGLHFYCCGNQEMPYPVVYLIYPQPEYWNIQAFEKFHLNEVFISMREILRTFLKQNFPQVGTCTYTQILLPVH